MMGYEERLVFPVIVTCSLMAAVVILLFELRDANALTAEYREVAYQAVATGEACAQELESQASTSSSSSNITLGGGSFPRR
jgi:hypothetical protein